MYTIDEKWFAVFLWLYTSTFDRAAVVALLKELLRVVARRDGDVDKGKAKGGDKVNFVIEGGDKENLVVALHKEIFFQLINISNLFLF
jgi:hypothetical protein